MDVELREATRQDTPVLRRLMQLYLYDLGTIDGWDVGDDGVFGDAAKIEGFWADPKRRSFLIRVDGRLAGFALVRDGAHFAGEGWHEISEFFVLRRYRRRSVGTEVARRLFDTIPGKWEGTELRRNVEAQAVWRRVIARPAGGWPGRGEGAFLGRGGEENPRRPRHTAAEGRGRVEMLNRMVLRLVSFPLPTIAMVDGYAVGAGSNLALCCDLIVASDRAKFGELFCKIGLAVDGGGTWFLPRVVGLARAKELVFTGDVVDAAEAARLGLVNRVVPAAELETATRALAAKIAAGPPLALRLDKQMLNRAVATDLGGALEAEASSQGLAIASDDHREGVAAFFDKRPPKFTGR